jgi:hypothetical protein
MRRDWTRQQLRGLIGVGERRLRTDHAGGDHGGAATTRRWATLAGSDSPGPHNWVDSGDDRRAFADPLELASIQFFSNVLLYIPTGFAMVFGWYRRRHLVPIICLGLSVSIETIQFLALGRVASLDDVVLNVSGALVGYVAAIGSSRLKGAINEL